MRVRNYAYRTEQVYVDWVRRFILFHGKRHPRDMGALQVTAFLSHLATERCVSASTQNQAKSAILFLYEHVLGTDLPWLAEVVSAKPLDPTQLSQITAALEKLSGKKVSVSSRQDPDLLGGVVAKVGDTVYDGSLRTQLRNLRDELSK